MSQAKVKVNGVWVPVAVGRTGDQGPKGDAGDNTPSDASAATTWSGSVSIPTTTSADTRVRTLAGNVIINTPANGTADKAYTVTIIIKQVSSGSTAYTVTWPTTLIWANNAPAPAMPTPLNSELIVNLFWTGSAWRAAVLGVFYP